MYGKNKMNMDPAGKIQNNILQFFFNYSLCITLVLETKQSYFLAPKLHQYLLQYRLIF